jgi:hypothetical protein
MNRKTTIVLALALGAALLWFAIRRGSEEPSLSTDSPDTPSELADDAPKGSAPETPKPAAGAESEKRREPTAPADPRLADAPVRMGPVEELARLFETEAPGPAAAAMERHITATFKTGGTPPELLQSVACQRTVCRIETRWTAARAEPFLAAFMRLTAGPNGTQSELVDPDLAVAPADAIDASGVLAVTVYARLLEPAQRMR